MIRVTYFFARASNFTCGTIYWGSVWWEFALIGNFEYPYELKRVVAQFTLYDATTKITAQTK